MKTLGSCLHVLSPRIAPGPCLLDGAHDAVHPVAHVQPLRAASDQVVVSRGTSSPRQQLVPVHAAPRSHPIVLLPATNRPYIAEPLDSHQHALPPTQLLLLRNDARQSHCRYHKHQIHHRHTSNYVKLQAPGASTRCWPHFHAYKRLQGVSCCVRKATVSATHPLPTIQTFHVQEVWLLADVHPQYLEGPMAAQARSRVAWMLPLKALSQL